MKLIDGTVFCDFCGTHQGYTKHLFSDSLNKNRHICGVCIRDAVKVLMETEEKENQAEKEQP